MHRKIKCQTCGSNQWILTDETGFIMHCTECKITYRYTITAIGRSDEFEERICTRCHRVFTVHKSSKQTACKVYWSCRR